MFEFLRDEFLQRATDQSTLRFPEDETLADHFIDVEKSQLAAEAAVVAFFRFLEANEMAFEFFFVFEGGAVKSLELAFGFIA